MFHLKDETITTDIKNSLRLKINKMSLEDAISCFYPNLYIIQSLERPNYGTYDEQGKFCYPMITNCNHLLLEEEGAYLLENGEKLILFIRK